MARPDPLRDRLARLKQPAGAREHLQIFLNDHLALATGVSQRLALMRRVNAATPFGGLVAELHGEFRAQRHGVADVLRRLGHRESRARQVVATVGERVGRLKLNGQVVGHSPLSRVVDLDVVVVGLVGQQHVWRVLREFYGTDPRLEGVDLDGLLKAATELLERVEAAYLDAARHALAPPPTQPETGPGNPSRLTTPP